MNGIVDGGGGGGGDCGWAVGGDCGWAVVASRRRRQVTSSRQTRRDAARPATPLRQAKVSDGHRFMFEAVERTCCGTIA